MIRGEQTKQLIVNAIRERHILSLVYDEIPRRVEPHAFGIDAKGDEVLVCFQVGGEHRSEKSHDWDLLAVEQMRELCDTGAPFGGARPGYVKSNPVLSSIYEQL